MAKEKTDAKAKSADSKGKAGDAAEPAKPKKGRMGLVIAIVAVLALAGGGGAAWYFMRGEPDEKTADGKPAAAKAKDEKAKPAVFVTLEVFTVNLQPEGGDHLLQTTVSLKVADATVEQAIKQQMPEIRSRLLLLLSSKRPSEVTSVDGKQQLANQIADEVNVALNPAAPKKPAAPAADAKPAAEGPKPSAEATPVAKAPPAAVPAPAGPVLSVFFTTFIIQRS